MQFTITQFQQDYMSSSISETQIMPETGEEITTVLATETPALQFQAVCNAVHIDVNSPWHSIVAMDKGKVVPLPLFLSGDMDEIFIEFTDDNVVLRRGRV